MKIEDLPRPANYRRQMAKNGGYEMVPAYTAEEVLGILEGIRCEQTIPTGTRVVDRGFRFDGERQQHIPQLVIEFEPVPVNSGSGAKGWKDRDYVAAMLTTCDCPAKEMPFGRCCKAEPLTDVPTRPPDPPSGRY